jgi:hypothetical protein
VSVLSSERRLGGRLGNHEESEGTVTALCKAYPTHEAASSAVVALRAVGVDGGRIRVLMGGKLHDVGQERVGEFAGSAGPDAPVGSFAGPGHERSAPTGDFASTGGSGRIGSFADADRDTITGYADGVGRMQITGDHDVKAILVDAGLDVAAAERDVRALHEGWALVLVRDAGADAERVQQVLDEAV